MTIDIVRVFDNGLTEHQKCLPSTHPPSPLGDPTGFFNGAGGWGLVTHDNGRSKLAERVDKKVADSKGNRESNFPVHEIFL